MMDNGPLKTYSWKEDSINLSIPSYYGNYYLNLIELLGVIM